jgi:glycosyltransferase involved in cell wall biosynthesis
MPLSGSSIVAQALVRSGWSFGDRLLPPLPKDPAGTFVDAGLARFHDELLGAEGPGRWRLPGDVADFPPALAERAAALAAERAAGPGPWAWRDPRAALFLPAWDRVLPEARWIFAVRDPADVVWSLLRRGILDDGPGPLAGAARGIRLWVLSHRRILRFVRSRPDRCLVVAVPGDLTPEGGRRLDRVVRLRWGYATAPIDVLAAYNPHLLKTRRPRWVTSLVRLHPAARRLERELTDAGLEREPAEAGVEGVRAPDRRERPVVALVARERFQTTETFIQAHARRLPARVLLLHGPSSGLRTKDDLPIASLPERLASPVAGRFGAVAEALANRAFGRCVRRHRVQAVLAEYGTVGARILDACRAAGVPLVVHFHGFDAHREEVLRKHRDTYRRLFRDAAAIVAVSNDMVERLAGLGAPRDRLACVPCGVDVSLFTPGDAAQAPPAFVSVGRFVEKKAPHLTLLAFAEVVGRSPDARLVMVGDGPLLEPCQRLARRLGLGESVVFAGALPHAGIPALLRGARAFVLHSIRSPSGDAEGTPVAVLEAGASGLPVVATRHGGIEDVVVHGRTGFLVEEGDVTGMAEHLLELARRPELAAALGRGARERICLLHSEERSIARLWDVVRDARVPDGDGIRT